MARVSATSPAASRTNGAFDRHTVDRYRDALEALSYSGEGRVHMLIETPVPHRHATRASVRAVPGRGFAGDHARKSFYKGQFVPGREVSAIALEVLRTLQVGNPSVVGDNLITEGIDLTTLEPGDLIRVGDVLLERSRRPHQPCTTFRDRTSPEAFAAISTERYRGALFVVRKAGTMHVGDAISRVNG